MMIRTFLRASLACGIVFGLSCVADAQDLSRYRDFAFGASVGSLTAATGVGAGTVKSLHQRPALLQQFVWRPQFPQGGSAAKIEAVREVTFGFIDDQLFSMNITYDPRLVAGLTNQDLVDAVSTMYGTATLIPVPDTKEQIRSTSVYPSTLIARWQNSDYEFTLIRETYPATFRLVGASRQLDARANAATIEAERLDRVEAPQLEAQRVQAEADRKAATDDKVRTTNKSGFRP